MMNSREWMKKIRDGFLDTMFSRLYGSPAVLQQRERYLALLAMMRQAYPGEEVLIFSSPGRTELGGNEQATLS